MTILTILRLDRELSQGTEAKVVLWGRWHKVNRAGQKRLRC